MLGTVALACAAHGARAAWVVPTYRNARPVWRFAERAVSQCQGARVNRTEMFIEFPRQRGWLGVYSADNPVGGRGEDFDIVVCDEAAHMRHEVITDIYMPTLADRNGRLIMSSTPNGLNWFYSEYMAGLEDGKEQASWHKSSLDNPLPGIKQAFRRLRERVQHGTYPERTFRQEWLAEFIEDSAGVFRRVDEAATSVPRGPQIGHTYIGGIDWGRLYDATVFAVIDVTEQRLEHIERMTETAFALQRGRLKALHERYRVGAWVGEYNSIGGPQVEALQSEGLPIMPFITTNATKQAAIDALSLAIESGRLRILNDPVLIGQLKAFQQERLPSGLMRYSAPEGMHDDDVIALALAYSGASEAEGPVAL